MLNERIKLRVASRQLFKVHVFSGCSVSTLEPPMSESFRVLVVAVVVASSFSSFLFSVHIPIVNKCSKLVVPKEKKEKKKYLSGPVRSCRLWLPSYGGDHSVIK